MNSIFLYFLKLIIGLIDVLFFDFIIFLIGVLRVFSSKKFKSFLDYFVDELTNKNKIGYVSRKALSVSSSNCSSKLISNLLINQLITGYWQRMKQSNYYNTSIPSFLSISLTMACNLRCYSCSSCNYDKKSKLEFEKINKTIKEAKNLGIYTIVLTGGESFLYPELLEKILRTHNDVYFIIFTNGTLLNNDIAEMLHSTGNAHVIFCVDGFQSDTDKVKGFGTYREILSSMSNLQFYGIPYSFSVTLTTDNSKTIFRGDLFIDTFIQHGCISGLFFQQTQVSGHILTDIVSTPMQRLELKKKICEWKESKDITILDYHNDKIGCGGAGQTYFHINSDGYAEPCPLVHFATHNINHDTLISILKSSLFKVWRNSCYKLKDSCLHCPVLDCQTLLKEIIITKGDLKTHYRADNILTNHRLVTNLNSNSLEVERLFNEKNN